MDNAGAAPPAAAPTETAAGKIPVLIRGDARIGLYGGMFDPPHLGHLALAKEALGELWLEHVFFIPAAQAPLRSAPAVASVDDRLEMVRRAIAEAAQPRMALLDFEARAGGVSYTVNTVRQLHNVWPRARMVLLLGSDQLANLHLWHEPLALAKLVEFAVFDRTNVAPANPHPSIARMLQWRRVSTVQHPASSSEVRRRLRQGRKADDLLPRSVAAYIEEKKLYR